MKIIKHPGAESVDSAVRNDAGLVALVSFSGETAITAPSELITDHKELIDNYGLSPDGFFRLRFNSMTAQWSFDCPQDYKFIGERSERLAEYYRDGLRIIPEFLVMLGYFSRLELKNAPADIWDF